ncbi:hypothetical protein [Mannheimia massilioguelmaensis]|uniref:hypothetical protein n=1 Tax=Mannheimia massilioguelmaensis TaxID=1604354 RepID=UPI0005C8D46C|nr:hypothetical protein [Mannheimia massilioguelmaensis]
MESRPLNEKELLILKGNALRMKFQAQTQQTKREIMQPLKITKETSIALLASPVVKTFALNVLGKHLLTKKGLIYSVLGLSTLLALGNKKDHQYKESH